MHFYFYHDFLLVNKVNCIHRALYPILLPDKKLGRKHSRMSMERLQRKLKMDPIPEQSEKDKVDYTMPKFLEKKMKAAAAAAASGDTQTTIAETEVENGEAVKESLNQRRDEGLGESFDQQSEMSDSSLRSNSNSNRNSIYDQIPENDNSSINEVLSEHGDTEELEDDEADIAGNISSEITLDPAKLPDAYPTPSNSADNVTTDSPFRQRTGAIKRVSFLWQNAAGGIGEGGGSPTKEPYVYDGKPNGKLEAIRKKDFKKK